MYCACAVHVRPCPNIRMAVWTPDNVLSIEYPNESNIRCSPNLKSFFLLSTLDVTHVRKCSNLSCKRREAGPGPGDEAKCVTQHSTSCWSKGHVYISLPHDVAVHMLCTLWGDQNKLLRLPQHTHHIHDHTIILSVYQSTNLSGTMYHVAITMVTGLSSSLLRLMQV